MEDFETQLKGGHPNSLGNTLEVVETVLADVTKFEELFNCYFSDDEIVRLRTSSAIKRVCIAKKEVVVPYINRLLNEISKIDQASTQWTLAILYGLLEKELNDQQQVQATQLMKSNLEHHRDWIVLNTTMDTLGLWAVKDQKLKEWMIPHLDRLAEDSRKSVASKAKKTKAKLEK